VVPRKSTLPAKKALEFDSKANGRFNDSNWGDYDVALNIRLMFNLTKSASVHLFLNHVFLHSDKFPVRPSANMWTDVCRDPHLIGGRAHSRKDTGGRKEGAWKICGSPRLQNKVRILFPLNEITEWYSLISRRSVK
jgi:hypothetical protein